MQPNELTRRTILKLATAGAVALLAPTSFAAGHRRADDEGFIDVQRTPDAVTIFTETGESSATKSGGDRWEANGVVVRTAASSDALKVSLASAGATVKQIHLWWTATTTAWASVLGDHWERSYADLAWRKTAGARVNPWYVMATASNGPTHAIGVRTGCNAFCSWQIYNDGILLICDVRSGGVGVQLGDRVLDVCDVIARKGSRDASPFNATRAFCKAMCAKPRLADHVIYGSNDWYYAYGHNSPERLIDDAKLLHELTADNENRPYAVIDDGWQTKKPAELGQWSATRKPFGSMSDLAAAMAEQEVRPGIWMRPVLDELHTWPAEWHLKHRDNILDPSLPDVLKVIATDIARLRKWGYQLIKHDFSTFDLMGRWGVQMVDSQVITPDGWSFRNRTHTSAEIVKTMYQTIADAAGEGVILGCNTVSHLAAGIFQASRIGDDTSGNEWHRNPEYGVNTLAFRGGQHNTFYAADADCVGVTTKIEWKRMRQWLDLVSRSGTPLIVSIDHAALNDQVRADLKEALTIASKPQDLGEPIDWMKTKTPTQWKFADGSATYDWS